MWTAEQIRAIEEEMERQYRANPQWDEAKDVIEGFDARPILTIAFRLFQEGADG